MRIKSTPNEKNNLFLDSWKKELKMPTKRPLVGVSVIVFHPYGERSILLGVRIGSHGANTWATPGGHLEFGEHWIETAIRETKEETDIDLLFPQAITVTNNILLNDNKHYVDINVAGIAKNIDAKLMEPQKCEGWEWVKFEDIHKKEPLFPVLGNIFEQIKIEEIYNKIKQGEYCGC